MMMKKQTKVSKQKELKLPRYYVPKISKSLINKAMGDAPRYMKTFPIKNEANYIAESKLIFGIAKRMVSNFETIVTPEEAKDFAKRVNRYMKIQADKNNEVFTPIDAAVILKSFAKLRVIYRNLLLYFRGDQRSDYDISKGLYIHGNTGSGKTLIFDIFKEYTKYHLQFNSFRKVTSSEILDDVYKSGNAGGLNALDKYIRTLVTYTPINLYIEDFGAGQKKVKWMGNDIEPMGELIMRRYRYYKKYGTLTHVCTNIKPIDFSDHFGPRVCSRFSQMFNIINLNLFDWRKI